MHSVARHVQLAARPHALRHHRRHMCAALNGFAELMQRGLGVHQRLSELEEPIATALIERGWCALDGVMDYEAAEHVRHEMEALYKDGTYSLSYSETAETREKIWRPGVYARELESESWRAAPTLVCFLSELMATLPDVVNGGLDKVSSATNTPLMAPMISSSIFGHKLAVSVEDDAKYPKHLDNVSGGADKRKLTAVYYSNPAWDLETQGGAIRLYDGLDPPGYTDVAPCGEGGADRLLLFWSDMIVHEVLPMRKARELDAEDEARGHRHTFTVWLTTENDLSLLDPRSPLFKLREAHYPER